ncbi:MAG: hypothetical protein KAI94_00675, partial [Anaerolineales bacterium]|nr:hypothetical protein [Anaerolineales bacterium]
MAQAGLTALSKWQAPRRALHLAAPQRDCFFVLWVQRKNEFVWKGDMVNVVLRGESDSSLVIMAQH